MTQLEPTTTRDQQLPQKPCFTSSCSIKIDPVHGFAGISGSLMGPEGEQVGHRMGIQPWEHWDAGEEAPGNGKQWSSPFTAWRSSDIPNIATEPTAVKTTEMTGKEMNQENK